MGIGRSHLKSSAWRQLRRGVYGSSGLERSALTTLQAIHLHLPAGAAFSGPTAGWLLGLDLSPCDPVDVTVQAGSGVSGRAGVCLHRTQLPAGEVAICRDLPVTTGLRTVLDLGRRLPLSEAVIAVDMALHAGLAELDALHRFVRSHPGSWGVQRLRRVAELAEPATESPMETRLRLALVGGGLPRPVAQVSLHDAEGEFIARPDLLYPAARLAIEYDGGTHRDSLVNDDRRQNRLQNAGYRLLRFTAPDLSRPDAIVAQVRMALATRPTRAGLPANAPLRIH
jgi:hypothetical protein